MQQSPAFTIYPLAYVKNAARPVVLVAPPLENSQDLLDDLMPITEPMIKSYAQEEAPSKLRAQPRAKPRSQDRMQAIVGTNDIDLRSSSMVVSQPASDAYQQGKGADDLWSHLRAGFILPDLQTPSVQKQIESYTANPSEIGRASKRASKYLFHVMQEINKRNMPMEIALLPFVESSFNPLASSSAKAYGIWQFMPATAQHFNLQRSLIKDDRRDFVASTDAALKYLQYLHNMFGDWHLALTAYNWGEGSVQKAIKKNIANGRGTDFVSLSPLMPIETRNFVPRLLAYKAIISDPRRYSVTLQEAAYK
jgi:membrane-bound lytic murein transglycosylase D